MRTPSRNESILNYTTQIVVEKTVGEIQSILAVAGATVILTEYDKEGALTAISFRVMGPFGIMSFRLPGNVDKIFAVLVRDRRIAKRFRTREQAARVAWRIIKDGLLAQLAWVKAEMVTIEQVFLGYAQNKEGTTLYETLCEQRFSTLALPAPK